MFVWPAADERVRAGSEAEEGQMKLRMLIVRADGKLTIHELTDCPTDEQLQDIVGGDIELVRHFDRFEGYPCVAFRREQGALLGLPFNRTATVLWRLHLGFSEKHMPEVLVGDIVIIRAGDEELLREAVDSAPAGAQKAKAPPEQPEPAVKVGYIMSPRPK
jgi:hypothetical protein